MEQWTKWIPIEGLPTRIYKDLIIDNEDGILLEFSDEHFEKKFIIHFDWVLSYRNTDEGSLLKMLEFLDQHYGGDFYSKWSLFKVKNSDYLKWFHKVSNNIYDLDNVVHYVFITSDDVIEILSKYPPKITVSSNKPDKYRNDFKHHLKKSTMR